MAMLGSPCSPCCDSCGPEISSLPTRFEVDVVAIDADEKHWGVRAAVWYRPFTTATFSTGYVQNWHSANIESQSFSLPLQSIENGVATYETLAPGIILKVVCTPTNDGRYLTFFSCIPYRVTTQLYGRITGIGGDPTPASPINPADLLKPDVERPSAPTREYETLQKMRDDSVAITTTEVTNGLRSDGFNGPYTSKMANHAVTIGTRLACPSVTFANAFNTANIEGLSTTAVLTNQNWPMQIRSQARINLPSIIRGWWTRGGVLQSGYHVANQFPQSNAQGVPAPSGGGYENEFGFGPSAVRVVFDSTIPRPGFPFGDRIEYTVYGWANSFSRNIDITQIRAIYPDSTQQWPQT